MEKCCVFFEAGTAFLNIIWTNFVLQGVKTLIGFFIG
jgi:hypothetical protein